MAEKRMISKKIVESARFLKMPPSAQNLYFHLVLNTDDDGVVEAYPVLNMINANPDDLNILASKELIKLLNEDLVSYIHRNFLRLKNDVKKIEAFKNTNLKAFYFFVKLLTFETTRSSL